MKKQQRYVTLKSEILQQITNFTHTAKSKPFFAMIEDNGTPPNVQIILETDDHSVSTSRGYRPSVEGLRRIKPIRRNAISTLTALGIRIQSVKLWGK